MKCKTIFIVHIPDTHGMIATMGLKQILFYLNTVHILVSVTFPVVMR